MPQTNEYHHRVSAITLSSQRIFKSLNIWPLIHEKKISGFEQIHVWDQQGKGEIKFDARDIAEPFLGYIIENNVIQTSILERLQEYAQVSLIAPIHLVAFDRDETHVTLKTKDNKTFTAKLAIAADGAQSWLRQVANIAVLKQNYEQEAIVATVKTSLPHQSIARQVFLETGPLAFLPLQEENLSSIVWSLSNDEAKKIMALDIVQFKQTLAQAFAFELGEILEVSERYSFPLYQQQVKNYISSRLALLGDAAHLVHPLAGQGVNIGLLDAISLSQVIVEALKMQRDYASIGNLRRYERWRKADNFAMLKGIDIIKNLFASDKKTLQLFRSFGLKISNNVQFIKKYFIQQACGIRKNLPELAK